MVEVVRSERDGPYRYRITATDRGFLITMRSLEGAGVWIASEWLHRTREAADACLEAVKAFNIAWRAIQAGLPSEALLRTAETESAAHRQLCQQLNDDPLVGQEVRALQEEIGEQDGS